MDSKSDEDWMSEAITEARKGIGLTAPNPAVGAVLVKDGVVIGRGWHRRAGLPHAEREALADARERGGDAIAEGATAYVTLEPCSTVGRTPPCCNGLIEAKVARVVWGAIDPNPAHAGAAEGLLRAAGIETRHGVLREECLELIKGFASAQTRRRPWVIVKTAMSLDGRITRPEGEGQWLTGPASRAVVQELRTEVDAVATSGATLRADNPSLTLRVPHPHDEKSPLWRIVFSRGGDLPPCSKLFTDEFKAFTIVVLIGDVAVEAVHHARGLVFEENLIIAESLEFALNQIADRGVHVVLVEAGGRFVGELLDHQLVDEYIGFLAPMVCGGGPVAVAGIGGSAAQLGKVTTMVVDGDVMIRGVVEYPLGAVVGESAARKPCVFFDRDGVVNDPRDSYYVTSWSDFHFIDGIEKVIAEVKAAGCLAVLVTSQRGVGKGHMTERDLERIHEKMQTALAGRGAEFDAIYAYTGEAADGPGAKPRPDMIHQAVAEHGADLRRSVIIGDADRDIEMGVNAGIATVRLIAEKAVGVQADHTVDTVTELGIVLNKIVAGWDLRLSVPDDFV